METCCWVGGVFDASHGFLPGAVLFLRDLQLILQRVPLGIFRSPGVCPSASLVTSVGLSPSLLFCASPAPAGLQGFASFCTLCQGAPVGVVSAPWTTVSSPCWLSLTLGWVSFWTAVSPVSVGCKVCGLGCPSWFVHLFMSLFVLHLLLGWGGLVTGLWPLLRLLGFGLFWSSVAPSDALTSGRTLSLFSRRGFLPWAFVRTWVSRLRSCLGSYLLLEVLSFPGPGFRWAVSAVWLSRRLVFSWNLSLGSSLSLPVFADGLGWLRLILGYPPSVAWLWRLLPWLFVRYLLACPRGAAVPLDSLILW